MVCKQHTIIDKNISDSQHQYFKLIKDFSLLMSTQKFSGFYPPDSDTSGGGKRAAVWALAAQPLFSLFSIDLTCRQTKNFKWHTGFW